MSPSENTIIFYVLLHICICSNKINVTARAMRLMCIMRFCAKKDLVDKTRKGEESTRRVLKILGESSL